MRRFFLILPAITLASPLPGQVAPSPYSGEEGRAIKALSPEEVADYLAGNGMGYARVAELNHYPGPRHILDLADSLALSTDQRSRIEEIRTGMTDRAIRLGRSIVDAEAALDRLFAQESIGSESLGERTDEIARLQGELRATHLLAHIQTRAVLTPAQIARYDALRGYGDPDVHAEHEHG